MKKHSTTYIVPLAPSVVQLITLHSQKAKQKFELEHQNKSLVKFSTIEAAETWCNTMHQTIIYIN